MLYLTLRHYEYVTAIARQGSLSGAANDVNVSQPALSVALSRIEKHLGHRLFLRRKGAPMVLTPLGRSFVDRAVGLLAEAARLENPNSPGPVEATLTLGVFSDLAPFMLATALEMLKSGLPGVTVTCRVDTFDGLTTALLNGQVDLALTYDLGLDAGFTSHILGYVWPFAHVAADHPLRSRETIRLGDIAEFPLILSQEGLSVQHILNLFRQQGLNPYVAHRAASLETMRSLAAHNQGLGISYALPPGSVSYDQVPVHAIRISDEKVKEPIILTRHGKDPASLHVAKAVQLLTALKVQNR